MGRFQLSSRALLIIIGLLNIWVPVHDGTTTNMMNPLHRWGMFLLGLTLIIVAKVYYRKKPQP